MKRICIFLTINLFVITVSGGCKQSGIQSDDLITVNVNASYPKKELVLQDFMDVEYIPLETNDDFLCQGEVLAVGKDIILVKNYNDDGDIFVFDRNGKALKKINRRGQGPEEYVYIEKIVLDEDNGEMFINNNSAKKIIVYDLDGNFKRSFEHKENFYYGDIYNLDRENIICEDAVFYTGRLNKNIPTLIVVSKLDGGISKEIIIPYKEKIGTSVLFEMNGMSGAAVISNNIYTIIPHHNNFVVVEPSSDTIYTLLPDYNLSPFIVRTPPVQSMDPEKFLFPSILTERYYFMETVRKEPGSSITNLMYDKQEKAIFEYIVYNGDYTNNRQTDMKSAPVNSEIATWQKMEVYQLIEAKEKGELKGKLKEIADKLDEDDNPVIMLIKHKK